MNLSSRRKQNKKAIVLGGTYPHIQLLKNLSSRGYETLLIDYHDNPCAKAYADIHVQESTLDRDRVCEIAKKANVSLVICSCIDQANLIACSVAEELGLPSPYNIDIARIATNKPLMKSFMARNGIPTSPFMFVRAPSEAADLSLRCPLIVKPSDSNSSKGVTKIDCLSQLPLAIEAAIGLSRSNEAIIEEFVSGREIGFDFYVNDSDVVLLTTKERRKIPPSIDSAQQIYGCYWPARLTFEEIEDCKNIAQLIAGALGLTNSPLMIQAIVNDDGIRVIEFAARFGGGESVKIISELTGVDITDLSILSYFNESTILNLRPPKMMYAETFIYATPCEFADLVIINEADLGGVLEAIHQYKTRGMKIGAELTSNNRVGSFIVSGTDMPQLRAKITALASSIEVIDVYGNNCFRHEIYKGDNL
jgi:carbamoylphosphate synthase large subunit